MRDKFKLADVASFVHATEVAYAPLPNNPGTGEVGGMTYSMVTFVDGERFGAVANFSRPGFHIDDYTAALQSFYASLVDEGVIGTRPRRDDMGPGITLTGNPLGDIIQLSAGMTAAQPREQP